MQTFSPNLRSTFFRHNSFTKYIAESEYVLRNSNTKHGLFGKIDNIEEIEENHIRKLVKNKRIIHRGLISMKEWDTQKIQ